MGKITVQGRENSLRTGWFCFKIVMRTMYNCKKETN